MCTTLYICILPNLEVTWKRHKYVTKREERGQGGRKTEGGICRLFQCVSIMHNFTDACGVSERNPCVNGGLPVDYIFCKEKEEEEIVGRKESNNVDIYSSLHVRTTLAPQHLVSLLRLWYRFVQPSGGRRLPDSTSVPMWLSFFNFFCKPPSSLFHRWQFSIHLAIWFSLQIDSAQQLEALSLYVAGNPPQLSCFWRPDITSRVLKEPFCKLFLATQP